MGPPPPSAVPLPPPPPPRAMAAPRPSASTAATRLATHWVADTLAGDESHDFSVFQEEVARGHCSPGPFAGAPEATRQRGALRSRQQELSSTTPAAGGGAGSVATAGVLRAHGAPSPREDLFRLVREVESSGILEKDLLPPFSQDIQETICTKNLTLPENSLQLLKGVDPCGPESRSYIAPQEGVVDAVCFGTRSPERSPIVEENMSVGSVLASAGCDAPLQGSLTEPFSQQDKHDHTATVEPKSCIQKSPNLPHCANGEGAGGGGSSNQPSKVSSDEGPSAHATVTPGFDRISDVVPTDSSEPGHLPECITAQDTTMVSQPDSRKAHPNALEHKGGEKVNQYLEDLTLQSANVSLPISCNGANQGSKPETNLQPGTATEDRMAFEEQNADTSHLEVGGANKANQALHDDGSIMKNNTVHGGLTAQTAPVSQYCNVTSEGNCFSEQKNEKNRTDVEKDNCRTSIPSSSKGRDGESPKKTTNEEKPEDTSPEICVRSKYRDIDVIVEDLSQQGLCIKCGKDGRLLRYSGCIFAAHDSCFGSSVTFEGTDFYCPVCLYKKAAEAYRKAWNDLTGFLGTAPVSKQHDERLIGVHPGAANRDGQSNGCDTSKRTHENEACDLAHRDEEPHQQRKKQKINDMGNGDPKEVLTEKVPFQNSGPMPINKHSVLQNNSKTQANDPEKKQQAGDNEACEEAGNDNSSHETIATSQRRLQEEEPAVPSKFRKGIAKQDQHKPTSRRKRKVVRPRKRYSNPIEPSGRRAMLAWTEKEAAFLREAMPLFIPEGKARIPWSKILKYGKGVFDGTRKPPDLRSKWRVMMKDE